MTEYKGVLLFHSETGTEGGYWAMQDEKFMGLVDEHTLNTYVCTRCGTIWDRTRGDEPKVSFTYWSEPYDVKVGPNTTRREGGYRLYDEPHPELPEGSPGSLDESWNQKRNALALECYTLGHEKWELMHPDGVWSYEGLHVLHDGDALTVYDPDDPKSVVWDGVIKLKHYELFTQDAHGFWIHADQEGQDRETWAEMFLKGYPCKLVTT